MHRTTLLPRSDVPFLVARPDIGGDDVFVTRPEDADPRTSIILRFRRGASEVIDALASSLEDVEGYVPP